MLVKNFVLALFFFKSWCTAAKYTFFSKEESVYWACLDTLNPYIFTNDLGSAYAPNCQPTRNRFLSWLICNFDHQKPEDLDKSLEKIIENCETSVPFYNHTVPELHQLYEKVHYSAIDIDSDPSFDPTKNQTKPVIPPRRKVERFTRAYYSRARSESRTRLYGGAIFIYFAGCMLIGGIVTWSKILCPRIAQRFVGPKINAFRKLFTIPTVSKKHTENMRWKNFIIGLMPTRAQTYILFGYFALNVILSCVDYDIFPDNFYTSSKHQVATQTADLVQYRTGVISTIHTPVVFLLSGRNNLLLYLTGWPYETFLVYHKWTARGMWIHALVHSAAYTWLEIDSLAVVWKMQYWYWGGIATIVGGLMLFQASSYFRVKWYEIFKTIHFLFSALYIAGLWYHLRIFNGLWMEYVYASIGLWCGDHLLRICRLLWFGVVKRAECELFEEDGTIKMTIARPSTWKPFPGAFVYIYVLRPYGFWQSHPFTILFDENDADEKKIHIYIKAKKGLTASLAKSLSKMADKKQSFYVFVEGPYGFEAPLSKYENRLIITGGNGVPTGFSNYSNLTKNLTETSRETVKWIWIIRDCSPLKWFKDDLLEVQDRLGEIDIYITRMNANDTPSSDDNVDLKQEDDLSSSEKKNAAIINQTSEDNAADTNSGTSFSVFKELNKINIYFERPDIQALVMSEIQNNSKGSTAILSCGPPKMNDEIRDTVANSLNLSDSRVDYFEEAQVWS